MSPGNGIAKEDSHLEDFTTLDDLFRDFDFSDTPFKPVAEEAEVTCQSLDEILARSANGENFDFNSLITKESCDILSDLMTGFHEDRNEFSEESFSLDCPFDFETVQDDDFRWL